MLTFQVIRWKNFLSTGNVFTEMKLDNVPNALIVGENGAGKSTLLDALTYSLFGKPFRKLRSKTGLVNSVNEKECIVEVEFKTNNKQYKIVRGMKPNVFEIHCNGVILNQDSTMKDYQEYLEKFVLKMNLKSFTQIVVLGSAAFTPFMQMTPSDRRAVIEDVLDIQIFSVMNSIAKTRMQTTKQAIEENTIHSTAKADKKEFIEKTLLNLSKSNAIKKTQLQEEFDKQVKALEVLKAELVAQEKERDDHYALYQAEPDHRGRWQKFTKTRSKLEAARAKTVEDLQFFTDHEDCPTCRQSIDAEFRETEKAKYKEKIETLNVGIAEINTTITEITKAIENADQMHRHHLELSNRVALKKGSISHVAKQIDALEDQLKKPDDTDILTVNSKQELEDVDRELSELAKERLRLIDERLLINTSMDLLKDGGIKTKIIKQYLPIINKLINQYLTQMGFAVSFHINESFEETIKSRYRDTFSYDNFSQGEKMRIDLALLFTWRAVAKLKNSVNTNLLIFDEIFDGSLDANGTDEFLKVMWGLVAGTNCFVISHKQDQLLDKFTKVYRAVKVKNFSIMEDGAKP